ncbi:MAG: 50S ribosomal protein L11 methyltransferase [Oscillatoriales cyanobacterium C42_A2020_001]|nr:50S ribosomal protein L11 methyltransferase [Leptolyngbyaceae cyanobacterium C42_A2020_001]
MNWIELSTHTTDEAIDWIRTSLATTNSIKKLQIQTFSESNEQQLQTSFKPTWTHTVRLYLLNEINTRSQVETIIRLLSPLHRTGMIDEISVATVEEKDIDQSEQSSFRVGRFVIESANAQDRERSPNEIPLLLVHSLAFGSGLHPATVLSLKLIERYVTSGMNTLDLGCGSGILSVAMAKLGAQVLAIDNDAIAAAATQATVNLNQVADCVTVRVGSLGRGSDLGHWMGGDLNHEVPTIQPNSKFNLIAANILARIHITLAEDYYNALLQTKTQTSFLITAGYTNDYVEEINTTFAKTGFQQTDSEHLNEWTGLVHQL